MKKLMCLALALLVMLPVCFAAAVPAAAEAVLPITEISDEDGLQSITATGRYKLKADIILTKAWTQIKLFSGELDGAGHKISGYTGTAPMFGIVETSAVIKNIVFDNMKVEAEASKLCGLVSMNYGKLFNLTFNNLTIKGNGADVSGVVYDNYGTIENVTADVNITGAGDRAGGIAAFNRAKGILRYCLVSGSIVSNYHVGGFLSSNNGTVEGCINYAAVTGKQSRTGGIVGTSFAGSTLRNCINYGEVRSYRDGAPTNNVALTAGITNIEAAPYLIENCLNAGKVISNSVNSIYIGGINGVNNDIGTYVNNCYTLDGSLYRFNDASYTDYTAIADIAAMTAATGYKGYCGTVVAAADYTAASMLEKLGGAFKAGTGDYLLTLVDNTSEEPTTTLRKSDAENATALTTDSAWTLEDGWSRSGLNLRMDNTGNGMISLKKASAENAGFTIDYDILFDEYYDVLQDCRTRSSFRIGTTTFGLRVARRYNTSGAAYRLYVAVEYKKDSDTAWTKILDVWKNDVNYTAAHVSVTHALDSDDLVLNITTLDGTFQYGTKTYTEAAIKNMPMSEFSIAGEYAPGGCTVTGFSLNSTTAAGSTQVEGICDAANWVSSNADWTTNTDYMLINRGTALKLAKNSLTIPGTNSFNLDIEFNFRMAHADSHADLRFNIGDVKFLVRSSRRLQNGVYQSLSRVQYCLPTDTAWKQLDGVWTNDPNDYGARIHVEYSANSKAVSIKMVSASGNKVLLDTVTATESSTGLSAGCFDGGLSNFYIQPIVETGGFVVKNIALDIGTSGIPDTGSILAVFSVIGLMALTGSGITLYAVKRRRKN